MRDPDAIECVELLAHGYAKLSPGIIWDTATTSIPELLALCKSLLDE